MWVKSQQAVAGMSVMAHAAAREDSLVHTQATDKKRLMRTPESWRGTCIASREGTMNDMALTSQTASRKSWLTQAWQTLSSIKTGVVLIILVVIFSAAGTVILQRPMTDVDDMERGRLQHDARQRHPVHQQRRRG